MLTPRLKLIFEHVNSKIIADIGTDHAYIPIELVKAGICTKVIATDIKEGPASIAREHIRKNGLNIEVRVGSGLTVLKEGEVEQIIIAGMGGKLISDILGASENIASATKLILQTMNGQYELRKYLIKNGYNIVAENLTCEGTKVYNLFNVSPTGEPMEYKNEMDYHLPSFLKDNQFFSMLKEKKKREFIRISEGNKKSTTYDPDISAYYSSLLNEIQEM